MENFRVFRALGLSFKAWFANFIPITLIAAIIYSPVIIWVIGLPGVDALADGDPNEVAQAYLTFLERGLYLLLGLAALLSPLITYRVIQHMNGRKVSIMTSVKYGMRGIIPAVILAVVANVVTFIPFGGIIGTIITCIWFVAAPAGVAEKLGPGEALTRSSHLTSGRRWGIFGLNLLIWLAILATIFGVIAPAVAAAEDDPVELIKTLKQMSIFMVVLIGVYQLFVGIVQAVSYSLLRTDKEGVSNEELAKVFE